ncbi:hypothetical protein D3C80_2226220 [compost metagenome]
MLEPDILDNEIMPDMLQLILEGNDVLALAQADPEQPGQGGNHGHYLAVAPTLGQTHH